MSRQLGESGSGVSCFGVEPDEEFVGEGDADLHFGAAAADGALAVPLAAVVGQGASPAAVLGWIRKEHAALQHKLAQAAPTDTGIADVIEMDEIYTYVQKKPGVR